MTYVSERGEWHEANGTISREELIDLTAEAMVGEAAIQLGVCLGVCMVVNPYRRKRQVVGDKYTHLSTPQACTCITNMYCLGVAGGLVVLRCCKGLLVRCLCCCFSGLGLKWLCFGVN